MITRGMENNIPQVLALNANNSFHALLAAESPGILQTDVIQWREHETERLWVAVS